MHTPKGPTAPFAEASRIGPVLFDGNGAPRVVLGIVLAVIVVAQ